MHNFVRESILLPSPLLHGKLLGQVVVHIIVSTVGALSHDRRGPRRTAAVGSIERVGPVRAEHPFIQGEIAIV